MMPTLFVYSALVLAILLFAKNDSPLSLVGSLIILASTLLELFADRQMYAFKKRQEKLHVEVVYGSILDIQII